MTRKRGKRQAALAILLLALWTFRAIGTRAEKIVTLTFTGDCTLGCEESLWSDPESFPAYAERYGSDYFFRNFRDMFSADDLTVINLEGVLSDTAAGEQKSKRYRFRGPTRYAEILTGASVEVAGIANNHIADYGEQGLRNTVETLEKAGIGWARSTNYFIAEKDGIRIAVFAADSRIANTDGERMRRQMAELKDTGEANAVVVLFHNGHEYDAHRTPFQEKMGERYVSWGADLVIMHHPHVVQGITISHQRMIFYSLGNFVFGGNQESRVVMYRGYRPVLSLYALVVQAQLHFDDDGTYLGQQVVLYPVYTSSASPANNYQPYRVTPEDAEPVIDAIRFDYTDLELPITADADGLAMVVMPYLSAE